MGNCVSNLGDVRMTTLHIAPGYSAGASLRQAIRDASLSDDLLRWPDDLSCGPIDTDDSVSRAVWWGHTDENWKLDSLLNAFWDRVAESEDKLVVWFARHYAMEASFFLNMANRLGGKRYQVIDVTGLQFPTKTHDGTPVMTKPAKAVSELGPISLATMLGSERELTNEEKDDACQLWRQLKIENAPFRIVSESGLVSAPATFFDQSLLSLATTNWRKLARLIGDAMQKNSEPYIQVGDQMLQTRVISLIDESKLLAEGDPWDMRNCRVRLPDDDTKLDIV